MEKAKLGWNFIELFSWGFLFVLLLLDVCATLARMQRCSALNGCKHAERARLDTPFSSIFDKK